MTEVDVQKILNAGKTIMECCKKKSTNPHLTEMKDVLLAMKMVNVCG